MTDAKHPARDHLALVLDTDDLMAATRLARTMEPWFGIVKVGLELYCAAGPEAVASMRDLGFEDYFFSSGVCVVEWADKADLLWPDQHLRIHLKMMSETKRGILLFATGLRYCQLLQAFQKSAYATTSS
jgi:hypothetical protein